MNSTVPTARAHIYHMPRPRAGTRARSPPHLSAPEVHASMSFLQTPTLASALYLLLMEWMSRDYGRVAGAINAIASDTKYDEDEMQIFNHLLIETSLCDKSLT